VLSLFKIAQAIGAGHNWQSNIFKGDSTGIPNDRLIDDNGDQVSRPWLLLWRPTTTLPSTCSFLAWFPPASFLLVLAVLKCTGSPAGCTDPAQGTVQLTVKPDRGNGQLGVKNLSNRQPWTLCMAPLLLQPDAGHECQPVCGPFAAVCTFADNRLKPRPSVHRQRGSGLLHGRESGAGCGSAATSLSLGTRG